MKTLMDVWSCLDGFKAESVKRLPKESWADVKAECDDLFRQASGGKYQICPGWILGGLGVRW